MPPPTAPAHSPLPGEGQHIHGANRYTDSASDARAVEIIQLLLLHCEIHYIYSNLAVAAALLAGDALFLGVNGEPADPKPGKRRTEYLHHFRQRAPVPAPDLAPEERIQGHRQNTYQPNVGEQVIVLHPC